MGSNRCNLKRHYSAEERRRWISVLGRASLEQLRTAYRSLEVPPAYRLTNRSRSFRVSGVWFTRCAVETEHGETGTACIPGKSSERARFVALFDALLQHGERYEQILEDIVDPLHREVTSAIPIREPKLHTASRLAGDTPT